MLLLSSGFRMDSGANTRHYQQHQHRHQQHTATWTTFWEDVTTWLSGKQKNSKGKKRTSTILTETCGGQEGLLLSSLSDFQKTYYSFPEFDDYDSVEGQNWALDVTPGV